MRLYSLLFISILSFGLLSCSPDKKDEASSSEITAKVRVYHPETDEALSSFGNSRISTQDWLVFYEGSNDLFPKLSQAEIESLQPKTFSRIEFTSECHFQNIASSWRNAGSILRQAHILVFQVLPTEVQLLPEGTEVSCDILLEIKNAKGSSFSVPKTMHILVGKNMHVLQKSFKSDEQRSSNAKNLTQYLSPTALLDKGKWFFQCVAMTSEQDVKLEMTVERAELLTSAWDRLQQDIDWQQSSAWVCGFFQDNILQYEKISVIERPILNVKLVKYEEPMAIFQIGLGFATVSERNLRLSFENTHDFPVQLFVVDENVVSLDVHIVGQVQNMAYHIMSSLTSQLAPDNFLQRDEVNRKYVIVKPKSSVTLSFKTNSKACSLAPYTEMDYSYRFSDTAVWEAIDDTSIGKPIPLSQLLSTIERPAARFHDLVNSVPVQGDTCQ